MPSYEPRCTNLSAWPSGDVPTAISPRGGVFGGSATGMRCLELEAGVVGRGIDRHRLAVDLEIFLVERRPRSVLKALVIVSKAVSQVPVPLMIDDRLRRSAWCPRRTDRSARRRRGRGCAGAGAGVAGAAGAGVAASGLVAGAGGVCDCCARDGCEAGNLTAAAIPMQSASEEHQALLSADRRMARGPRSSILADFNTAAVRPPPPKCLHATGACRRKSSYKSLHIRAHHERAGQSRTSSR